MDKVYEQTICSELDDDSKLDVIHKINTLRSLITDLKGEKYETQNNIFDGFNGEKCRDDDADIVGHIKNNGSYYLERIQRLTDKMIYDGSEHYLNEELFELLRVMVNVRKLITVLCTKTGE